MKTFAFTAALLLGALAANANAQYIVGTPVTTYYAPAAPVVAPAYYAPAYAPVVVPARRVAYYAPAPVYSSYYSPAPVYSAYYAPAPVMAPAYAPVAYAPAAYPYVVARPVVVRRSLYGTPQVYVPLQPVRNTWRAITP